MVQYFADIYQTVSSAAKGLRITVKHLFVKPVTLQYPDERWVLPERFRGFVHNEADACIGCQACAKACPVSCIYIETEGKGKERFMTRYAIDFNKCIWCGLCNDPCPTDCLTMSHDYDHSMYFREKLVYEFCSPDRPIPTNNATRKEMGFPVKEKEKPAPKPKPKADAEPKAEAAPEPKTEAEPAPEPKPEAEKPAAPPADDADKGEDA